MGGGGRGFRAARMLASGDLQLVLLALLQERPRYGYEIVKELEEKSSGFYTPSPGVVYPALTYLEEAEFAVSEPEGKKRIYSITEAGTAHLEKNKDIAEEILRGLDAVGMRMAKVQKYFTDEEAENELEQSPRGSGSQAEWAKFKANFREFRDKLRSVVFELVYAPAEEKERALAVLRRAFDEIRKNGTNAKRETAI